MSGLGRTNQITWVLLKGLALVLAGNSGDTILISVGCPSSISIKVFVAASKCPAPTSASL